MPALSAFKNPATAISIAALVVACSGGAFAAGSAINGNSIKNGTVSLSKLTPALRAEITRSSRITLQTVKATGYGVATCPIGYQVTGGGSYASPTASITGSVPIGSATYPAQKSGWASNDSSNAATVTFAVCAKLG